MQNGFIDAESGKRYPMKNRDDLAQPSIQEVLRQHRGKSRTLFCLCGLDQGLELPLISRKQPVGVPFAPTYREFNLVRDDISEHPSGCCLERPSDDVETTHRRTARIFQVPEARIDRNDAETKSECTASMKRSYDTFVSYSRRVFSLGSVLAFREGNRLASVLHRMPSPAEVFRGIDLSVKELKFSDGQDGYSTAEGIGCRFRFGLLYATVKEMVVGPPRLRVYWWDNDTYRLGLNPASFDALETAVADLKIFRNYQKPPYVIAAVENSFGLLTKVFLHQIYLDSRHLVFVDSGYEASQAAQLIWEGRLFLKPVRVDDCCNELKRLGLMPHGSREWDYRPDIVELVFRPGCLVRIQEVRGFRKDEFRVYDTGLATKEVYFKRLGIEYGWEYEEVLGFDLLGAPEAEVPSAWPGVKCGFEPPVLFLSLSRSRGSRHSQP